LFQKRTEIQESAAAARHRVELVRDLTFEVVPMKSLPGAIDALPDGAQVSVTCSPVRGIAETQRATDQLLDRGFSAIPHISARLVRDRAATVELATWFRSIGVTKVFVVGGDSESHGAYSDAIEFLRDLLDTEHGLTTIGVPAYPDSHQLISDSRLQEALRVKQQLLGEAGVAGYCSTQMCFDPTTIAKWMRTEREHGLTLPIHLGIAGVVDKTRLLSMGARLGIGQSLSYFRKNKGAVAKMLISTAYDPNDLLVPLSEDMVHLGVEGLHIFTFNQVAATADWQSQNLPTPRSN